MARTAQAALGVSMIPAGISLAEEVSGSANALTKPAKNCIFLYMSGGMTHIDTFDPKSDPETKGPCEPINTNASGMQISQFLPELAKHGDKMTIIRSMTSKSGVHESGNYLMHTGYNPRGTIVHPTIGPWAQKLLGRRNKGLPDSVTIGAGGGHPGSGFLGPLYSPIPINDPNSGLQNSRSPVGEDKFAHRMDLANQFDAEFRAQFPHKDVKAYTDFYDETLTLLKSEDLKAFDLSEEPANLRATYGQNGFGQGCLLARRLIERNVRVVEVQLGGWDMHTFIEEGLTGRANTLDVAMSALLDDLKSRGLLDDTLVVVCTEFGRTPRVNQNRGRDHYPRVFTSVLAGGPVKRGYVYGASDEKGVSVADKKVEVPDFIATVGHALGLDTSKTVFSPSGRPFTVGDKGQVHMDVFA